MFSLLTSLGGKPSEDASDSDLGENNARGSREGSVRSDLQELQQTFSKQLRGVTSFLAGDPKTSAGFIGRLSKGKEHDLQLPDDVYAIPDEESDKSPSYSQPIGFPIDAEEEGVDHEAKSLQSYSEFSEANAGTKNVNFLKTEDAEGHAHPDLIFESEKETRSTDEVQDNDEMSHTVSSGGSFGRETPKFAPALALLRNDFAELSGTLKSNLSRFSSVIKVVTGEDLVKHAEMRNKEQMGNNIEDKLRSVLHEDLEAENGNTKEDVTKPSGSDSAAKKLISMPPVVESTFIESRLQSKSSDADEQSSGVYSEQEESGWGSGVDDIEDDEDPGTLLEAARGDIHAIKDALTTGFSGMSKFASSLLKFKADKSKHLSDHSDNESVPRGEPPGMTDEIILFASTIATHPETWIDFPLPEVEDQLDDFELSQNQEDHVEAMEYAAPGLAALRLELTPVYMSEARFWKVYFVLLLSRLNPEHAALLATPQILEAREAVLESLRKENFSSGLERSSSTEARQEQKHGGLHEKLHELTALADSATADLAAPIPIPDNVQSVPANLPTQKAKTPIHSLDDSLTPAYMPPSDENGQPGELGVGHESEKVQEIATKKQVPVLQEDSDEEQLEGGVDEDEEAEADDWLEDEDEDNAGTKGGSETAGRNSKAFALGAPDGQDDEDISFSDFEEEEEANLGSKGGLKEGALSGSVAFEAELRPRGAAGNAQEGGNARDWIQLKKPGSEDSSSDSGASGHTKRHAPGAKVGDENESPSWSDKSESAEWLTVDEDGLTRGGH